MVVKSLEVKKVNINSCMCCETVGNIVSDCKEKYIEKYKQDHPETTRKDYSIEDDVNGIPGYEFSGSRWSGNYVCPGCMDALLKATKVLQANALESASVAVATEISEASVVIEEYEKYDEDGVRVW